LLSGARGFSGAGTEVDGVPLLFCMKQSIMAVSIEASCSRVSGVPPRRHFIPHYSFRTTPLVEHKKSSVWHICLFTHWRIA